MAESDDKFSHTKHCVCGCKIKQNHAGNLHCGVCGIGCSCACVGRGRNRQAGCLLGSLLLIQWGISVETGAAAALDHFLGQM